MSNKKIEFFFYKRKKNRDRKNRNIFFFAERQKYLIDVKIRQISKNNRSFEQTCQIDSKGYFDKFKKGNY